jgi:hypothetical protein
VGGAILILLPLSGSHALLFAPSFSLWFAYCGSLYWRAAQTHQHRRWVGAVLIGSAVVALGFTGLYFLRYERPSWRPPDPTIAAALETAVKFLAIGFGPAVRSSWIPAVAAILGALAAGAFAAARAVLRSRGQERYRAFGVLLFVANIVLLALATGWGRATAIQSVYGQYPLRYVLMAAPALLVAFFAWELYGPTMLRAIIPGGLCIAMCLLLPLNTLHGLNWLYWFSDRDTALERDLRAGIPAAILSERYRDLLLHWVEPDQIAGYMRMLRDAGIGPFAYLTADPIKPIDLSQDASPVPRPLQGRSVSEPTHTTASVVQEIRYTLPEEAQVYLVWGINGWRLAPEELFPAGTTVRDNVMHTPMVRTGDVLTAKIRVPAGTQVNYGFLMPRKPGLADMIWPVWSASDWSGDHGYQTIVSTNGVTSLQAPQAVRGYLFSIDFGRFLLLAIGIVFGVAVAIPYIQHMIRTYAYETRNY